MTKKEQTLFDALTAKGFVVESVSYYSSWSWHPLRGWYAIVQDPEDESCTVEYKLGSDFIEACGQIENDEIKKVEE